MSERFMWYKDVKKGFGLTLKKWRGRTGISQEELAGRAGLHRSYIADIERGTRNLSLQSIEKLARALKVSLSTLFEPLGEFSQPDEAAGPGGGPVDILLVEDDPRDVELTLAAFKRARLTNRVQVVGDGAQALDFVFNRGAYARRKTANRPQVILLDLNLPKVPGLEVLRALKGDRRTRQIRVVVLTVSQKDEHIGEAHRLGADAYISKPVDFHRFSKLTPGLDFAWALVQRPTKGPDSRREVLRPSSV